MSLAAPGSLDVRAIRSLPPIPPVGCLLTTASSTLSSSRPPRRVVVLGSTGSIGTNSLDVIAHQGVLEEGVNLIEKPFSPDDLLLRIRDILNRD